MPSVRGDSMVYRDAHDRDDRFHDECGVFGVFGARQASELVFMGLYALQHRGQESAGIVSTDGQRLFSHKGMGLVSEVFKQKDLRKLKGKTAMGHNRYSTHGSTTLANAQPLVANYKRGELAVAHNGNLVNAGELRLVMEQEGSIFQSTSDSEVFIHLMARSQAKSMEESVVEALSQVRGAYSLLMMSEDSLYAIRDPYGFRPLCVGKLKEGWVFASESCALDIVGATYERNVEPGEMIVVDKAGLRARQIFPKKKYAACIFELIYFARPDSLVYGRPAEEARNAFGRQLAREHPVDADIVIAVPDSSNTAAMGYSEESGIPLKFGLIRNHYIGRTFIHPSQGGRDLAVKIKFNPVKHILEGKRVIVVDDSIVRGSTARKLVKMIRRAGAKEIHYRVSSPPTTGPCYYGIDTPTKKELIAANMTVEEIRQHLGADSLAYLSLEGMLKVAPLKPDVFCTACFSGDYPVPVVEEIDKFELERNHENHIEVGAGIEEEEETK
jgi:amidophosphoribosyltransferase